MKTVDTVRNLTSTVEGADVTIKHRVTCDATGVKTFSQLLKEESSVGYVNLNQKDDRLQIFFEPFSATTTDEKTAIVAAALADLDELLTTLENNG